MAIEGLVNVSWTNAPGNLGVNSSFSGPRVPADASVSVNHVTRLIYILCVCEMRASLGAEPSSLPPWAQVVQKLTQMIGKNVKLYDMVLQFLRTLFLRTRNVHYCTLRAELLMSLHDLEISEICTVDPCHKVPVMWDRWGVFMENFLEKAQRRWVLSVERIQTLNLNVILCSLDLQVKISSWLSSSLLSFYNPWIIQI